MLTLKRGNQTATYKHMIVPIKKQDGTFEPNWERINKILDSGDRILILSTDFAREQKQGNIILINLKGGWCFLTADDELA